MKKQIISYSVMSVFFLCAGNGSAEIITYPTVNADDLAANIAGPGIAISNAKITQKAYEPDHAEYSTFGTGTGIFVDDEAAIGFDSGIILSNGDVAAVPGPNTYSTVNGDNYLDGDADLNTLLPGYPSDDIYYSTYDATVFEFDFVADPAFVPGAAVVPVTFQYVFASDEYNEYVGSIYNDVFGFFVNGSNVALLPDGTPVAIGNVNMDVNAGYYINNDIHNYPALPVELNTEMDGLTVVLTARVDVVPGETNHIKMAIGDTYDWSYDSNVFIKADSFRIADSDDDGIVDPEDNCWEIANPSQEDMDQDGIGDVCDDDNDNDGLPDSSDNCQYTPNPGQEDWDQDGIGDVCDADADADQDGIVDPEDNCPETANPGQEDADQDGIGDACDDDSGTSECSRCNKDKHSKCDRKSGHSDKKKSGCSTCKDKQSGHERDNKSKDHSKLECSKKSDHDNKKSGCSICKDKQSEHGHDNKSKDHDRSKYSNKAGHSDKKKSGCNCQK